MTDQSTLPDENNIELLKWAVTTVIGIIGIFVGRSWAKNDKRIIKDIDVFNRYLEFLPYEKMYYIETYDFGGAIDPEDHRFLHRFKEKCGDPNLIFINNEIEEKKNILIESIDQFLNHIASFTYPYDVGGRLLIRISQDDPEYSEKSQTINEDANKVFACYSDFIHTCRVELI